MPATAGVITRSACVRAVVLELRPSQLQQFRVPLRASRRRPDAVAEQCQFAQDVATPQYAQQDFGGSLVDHLDPSSRHGEHAVGAFALAENPAPRRYPHLTHLLGQAPEQLVGKAREHGHVT